MKMVNVLSDLMEEVVPTFYRVNSQDDKDMILARVEVRDMMVNNVGIMDFKTIDRAPTNSEHWPIAMELNVDAIFGVDGESLRHPKVRMMRSKLRSTSSEEEKYAYEPEVGRRFKEAKVLERIEALEKDVANLLNKNNERYGDEKLAKQTDDHKKDLMNEMV